VGGSSGSPVFDLDWNVFAVHHAGDPEAPRLRGAGTYAANEGIAVGALIKAIAAKPGGPR
jgi:V8-like Glu-specific endopeptidase